MMGPMGGEADSDPLVKVIIALPEEEQWNFQVKRSIEYSTQHHTSHFTSPTLVFIYLFIFQVDCDFLTN